MGLATFKGRNGPLIDFRGRKESLFRKRQKLEGFGIKIIRQVFCVIRVEPVLPWDLVACRSGCLNGPEQAHVES